MNRKWQTTYAKLANPLINIRIQNSNVINGVRYSNNVGIMSKCVRITNEVKRKDLTKQSAFWAYANNKTYNLFLHKWHLSTKLFLVSTNNHLSNLITCPWTMIVVVRCIFFFFITFTFLLLLPFSFSFLFFHFRPSISYYVFVAFRPIVGRWEQIYGAYNIVLFSLNCSLLVLIPVSPSTQYPALSTQHCCFCLWNWWSVSRS